MNKLNISSLVASVLAIVISLVALGNAGTAKFGSYVTGAGVTNFDIVDAALGFRVNGTTVINSSGNIVATGSGNRITGLTDVGSKIVLTGGVATTSLSAAQLCTGSYVEWSPSVANATATLPTQAALNAACLTTNGDQALSLVWKNTSNAASTTLFAAGASTTIVYANATTTTGTAPSVLAGGSYMKMDILVTSSTDPTSGITYLVSQYK